MTVNTQKIVPPDKIDSELVQIWDALSKANKMRASLFNLIVFNRLSPRTDYIRSIVQKLIDTFPCRILFISHDPDPTKNYLKTAVSVSIPEGETKTACDDIDIGVAGSDWERVPYLILPHILPDLPVYLLWAEDPSEQHALFQPLAQLAHRVIFDSEAADNLLGFSQAVLSLKGREIADLNWVRLEGWRDLLSSTFSVKRKIDDLKDIKEFKIVYNACETPYFCHLKIQSMYLLSLFASRLGWTFTESKKEGEIFRFCFAGNINCSIEPATHWTELSPGSLISVDIATHSGSHFSFARNPKLPRQVSIHITTSEVCEIPYQFVLAKTGTGQSLVREIFLKGTSPFFLETLRMLSLLDQKKIC